MTSKPAYSRFLPLFLLLNGLGETLHAQTAAPPPAAVTDASEAVRTCVASAEQGRRPDALAGGRRAEILLNAQLARRPRDVETLVALARALSQCILPSAEMMEQGELSTRAIELLQTALEIEPTNWVVRYGLASINFRSPAFLGRAPQAAADFDVLLRMSGDRADNPRLARVFEYRGTLWRNAGQLDSARAVWQRGARLFPADTTLRGLFERAIPSKPAAPAGTAPAVAAQIGGMSIVASAITPPAQTSAQRIDKSRMLMTAGGAADIMQAVQMQPGATHVGEGSDIYSRGGDPSETAIVVDGGRVATISRFEGLSGGMFGAIEPFVVRSISYSSGGFSVRHGNALSGVIEIETDGRPRERQLRAGMSLVQASGTARVPFNKTMGGWVSARVSQTAALLATHGRSSEYVGAPHSEEAIASLISNPSPTTELRATAIVEQDDARPLVDAAGWIGPFHSAGGSRSVLLSSRWIAPASPLTVRTSLVGTSRRSRFEFGILSRARDEESASARADADWSPTEALSLRAGVEQGTQTRRDRGVVPTTSSLTPGSAELAIDGSSAASQAGGYAEARLAREATSVTAGMRVDRLPGESTVSVDPRVAISTQRGSWIARAGVGLFHQGRWRALPTVPDAGTPSGLPGAARHVIVGLERDGALMSLRAEGFVKRYDSYSAFGAGPQIVGGSARGVDVIAQKKSGERVSGFLGYSFLDATSELAGGITTRSPFDVTHSLTATATTTLNADWTLGTTLRYATGAPHSAVIGTDVSGDGRFVPRYGALMGERLPAYARADARLMHYVRAKTFLLTSFVEVLNLLSRHNVAGVTYDASYREQRPVHSFFASRTVVVGGEFQFR